MQGCVCVCAAVCSEAAREATGAAATGTTAASMYMCVAVCSLFTRSICIVHISHTVSHSFHTQQRVRTQVHPKPAVHCCGSAQRTAQHEHCTVEIPTCHTPTRTHTASDIHIAATVHFTAPIHSLHCSILLSTMNSLFKLAANFTNAGGPQGGEDGTYSGSKRSRGVNKKEEYREALNYIARIESSQLIEEKRYETGSYLVLLHFALSTAAIMQPAVFQHCTVAHPVISACFAMFCLPQQILTGSLRAGAQQSRLAI